jgi:curli biogenesis system outer membrane secretion channel CsgG
MLTGASGVSAQGKSARPTVALLDFDFGTVQQWWSGNWDIGKGISDMIVDELVNDGSFRVIERKRLDAILAEQNFSNSERADPDAASVAKIGKALGVSVHTVIYFSIWSYAFGRRVLAQIQGAAHVLTVTASGLGLLASSVPRLLS